MLACARIGATHTVIFGGFSADALRDRINDCGAKVLLTQDGAWRRGNVVPLKKIADEALEKTPSDREGRRAPAHRPRARARPDEGRAATSGGTTLLDETPSDEASRSRRARRRSTPSTRSSSSTRRARPESRRACCTRPPATSRARTSRSKYVFDLREDDVYWCTADVGWVTGHSYIVYGPLSNGATCLMYEGAPNAPDWGRFWSIIEKHGVTILYTAPTAIRAFIRAGDEWPKKADLVEPAPPRHRSASRSTPRRGSGTTSVDRRRPLPDRRHVVADRDRLDHADDAARRAATRSPARRGCRSSASTSPSSRTTATSAARTRAASSSSRSPWPSMVRTLWGDDERFREDVLAPRCPASTSRATARGATRTATSGSSAASTTCSTSPGHRIGTAEIESALVSHPAVAEAAAVGRARRAQGSGARRVRHAEAAATTARQGAQGQARASTSTRRSGSSRAPTRSASPTRCRRRAAARSCAGSSRTSPRARETKGDTSTLEDPASSPSSAPTRSETE